MRPSSPDRPKRDNFHPLTNGLRCAKNNAVIDSMRTPGENPGTGGSPVSQRVLASRTLQGCYRGEQEASHLRKQGITVVSTTYRQGMVARRGAAAADVFKGAVRPEAILR